MAKVTGIGGLFFKAHDPKTLASWYRDVLGLPLEDWGGALLGTDVEVRPPHLVWCPFRHDTDYFTPSTGAFMVNFAVDDLDGMIARIESKKVVILGRGENDPNGRFAWLMDPEGTKIELWEPKK